MPRSNQPSPADPADGAPAARPPASASTRSKRSLSRRTGHAFSAKTLAARVDLSHLSRPTRWALLVALSLAVGGGLEFSGIPAALLIGPMIGGIVLGIAGGALVVARWPYRFAQAFVGCLIASTFKPDTMHTIGSHWLLFVAIVLATYASSLVLGWGMTRLRILPGSTAVWGSSPGAASAMMLMAEAFGADPRMVAFMQYLRVVFVALSASIVARLWISGGAPAPREDWLPAIRALPFAETLALGIAGAAIGPALRIPAGSLLVPMVVGGALRATGIATLDLPPWLLAVAYAVVGWKIGLGFTRDVVGQAARAALPMAISVVILIVICGGFAAILVFALAIDPLTAYLATSPGGMDSIAIIGASTSTTNLPFIMALHAMRFIIVLTVGPAVARFVARRAAAAPPGDQDG